MFHVKHRRDHRYRAWALLKPCVVSHTAESLELRLWHSRLMSSDGERSGCLDGAGLGIRRLRALRMLHVKRRAVGEVRRSGIGGRRRRSHILIAHVSSVSTEGQVGRAFLLGHGPASSDYPALAEASPQSGDPRAASSPAGPGCTERALIRCQHRYGVVGTSSPFCEVPLAIRRGLFGP